jgi:hypothetical protein
LAMTLKSANTTPVMGSEAAAIRKVIEAGDTGGVYVYRLSTCPRTTQWLVEGVQTGSRGGPERAQRGSREGPEGVQRGSRGGPEGVQRGSRGFLTLPTYFCLANRDNALFDVGEGKILLVFGRVYVTTYYGVDRSPAQGSKRLRLVFRSLRSVFCAYSRRKPFQASAISNDFKRNSKQ